MGSNPTSTATEQARCGACLVWPGAPLTLSTALFAAGALGAYPAIASAWFWRRSVTVTLALAVLAATATALAFSHLGYSTADEAGVVAPPLALAALAMGKDRLPRCWLWIADVYLSARLLSALLAGIAGYPTSTSCARVLSRSLTNSKWRSAQVRYTHDRWWTAVRGPRRRVKGQPFREFKSHLHRRLLDGHSLRARSL